MSMAINLIQVLLPDSLTILSASLPSGKEIESTAGDLVYSLLSDPVNAASLYGVFGTHYNPASVVDNAEQDTTSTWWLDTSRMPWGIQTVEVVPANKEWHQNELDHLGEGLLPLTTPIFPFLHALLTPRADGTLKLSHQPFYAAAQGNMASPPKSGFSDFTLSSHLHTPRLRLVCGAPGLSVRLKFAHVPEIYDGWEGRVFFLPASWDGIGPATGTGTRVSEVVEAVCEELGIRRVVLQGSKSARVEYALADVTTEQISMPPPPPLNGQLCLPEHLLHLSGNPQAYPKLYFTISAKWLNRLGTVALGFSKHARKNLDRTRVTGRKSTGEARPKQVSSEKFVSPKPAGMFGLWGEANASKAIAPLLTPLTTGDKELDDLANESLGSEEEDAELNGTLKGATTASREEADQSASEIPGRKKASNSHTTTARLSKMFEGWIGSAAEGNVDTSPGPSQPSFPSQGTRKQARVDRPKSRVISSPISAQKDWSTSSDSGDENLEEQFELLMQDMGIKGNSRAAMLALSDDRKRFLIAQNDAAKSTPSRARIRSAQGTGSGASPSPDSSGGLADTLSRAGTAFAWGNRFSIASIAGWSGEEPATVTSSPLPSSSTRESCTPSSGETSVGTDSEVSEAIKSNATGASAGGIWSSWWGGSGDAVEKGDPAYYPRLLLAGRLSRKDLVKTLLSLRVTLSSSKLVWISGFLDERGLDALERTLQVETQPFVGDQATVERKEMADVILSESVKCLRTLMNTEPGFDRVLQQPHLINCITYSLKAPSFKVRSQVADLLGAMCVLSSENGHRLVCSALSELRVAAKQRYRFAFLVDSLSLEAAARDSLTSTTTSEEEVDEAAIWEYRTSALVLINALANGPEDLEERIGIREEFSKRGLNEVVVALGYADPPDGVLTQIQVYNEERQDDLDELHERALAVTTNIEQPFGEAGVILQRIESDFYSRVVDVLKACSQIVARDVDHQFRSELFFLIEKFVVNCAGMSDFDESWRRSTRLYLASVEHIVGKQAMIKASRISDTSTVPSSFVEELEGLRQKVEELSDDKQRLKAELKDTIAQTNTLRSLPEANAILKRKSLHDTFAGNQKSGTENENFGGVIQRLIQKEKQVLELQAELDRLTGSSAVTSLEEEEERAKRERQERSRQWSNLMDEIAKLKERLAEGEAVLESREREIRYLKRALEAVYSRFQSSVGVIPAPNVRQANTSSDPQQDLSAVQASSIDADTIAEKTIEALGDRDAEIASLRSDVAKLQDQMIRASQAQSKSEEDLRSSHAGVLAEQQAREEALKETISDLQSRMAQLQAQQGPQIRLPASVDASALLPPPPPPPPPTPSVASVSVGPSLLTRSDPASGAAPPPPPPPPIFSSVLMANGLTPAPPRPPTPPGMADPPPPPPPPPAFAGVPLPPPPPPAMLQMPNIPEKRRKPLFWSKLPVSVVVKTVWNDLPNDQINVRLDDLDKIFAIQNTAVEARKPGMSEAKKGSHTTVLDLQRAQNIAIMLSRVKLSFTQIRQALLEVESAHLTLETLKVIRNCLPNNEEAELIREYQGDFALLSKADQFCKEIVGIPKLKSRVDCMIYMKKFELDLEELKPDLRILQQAVSEVNSSKKFKLILKNILMLGNILNNKTFRGEARGFVLSDLLKLRDTRAAIAPGHKGVIVTPTLLHYLVQVLNQEDPALVGFLDDWRHVEAAARVSTTSVASGVTAMVNGMTMIQVEVKTLRQMCIMSTNDKFVPMCDGFLKESAPQVEMLKKSSEQISKELSKMMEYFGETDKNAKPEDFFSLLGSFGQSLMQAELEVKDNEARAQREKSKGATANRFLLKLDTPAPLVVTTTLLKSLNEDDEGEGGKTKKEEDKISPPGATAVHAVNPVPEEEEEEEEEEVTTPLAMASCNSRGTTRGSLRFRSWGQSAVATLPEEVEGTEDLQQTTIGRKARVGGVRGQLDEAIKELRMGGPNNGRKSLRRQDTRTAHRPLSRVFLDT